MYIFSLILYPFVLYRTDFVLNMDCLFFIISIFLHFCIQYYRWQKWAQRKHSENNATYNLYELCAIFVDRPANKHSLIGDFFSCVRKTRIHITISEDPC